MFKKTQIKLTIIYSLLFLILFWGFSFGIYVWMEHSFGEGYISKVKQVQQQQGNNIGEHEDKTTQIAMVSGDVALNQLRDVLLTMNGIFLIIVPMVSWMLAKKSLTPIEIMYKQQKQFVSDASHELRTPLSIIKGEFDVLLQKKRSPAQYQKTVQSSREEINRLTSLVENLLILARMNAGNNHTQMTFLDLPDTINRIISKLTPKIQQKQLSLHFTPPKENTPLYGQEVLLSQLFFNLIDNAITYTPKKGTIWITLEEKKQNMLITVRDTGIGIPIPLQRKIFDRFYRVDTSRTQTKGFGLGLAIAKAIVEKHKGSITVLSQEDKGTTFTVSLPLS